MHCRPLSPTSPHRRLWAAGFQRLLRLRVVANVADNSASLGSGLAPDNKFSSFMASVGMPSPDKYVAEGKANLDAEKAERKPLEVKQEANISKMFENAKALKDMQAPKEPTLKDIPDAPDSEYRDPMQSLGSMASVLAMFGSLKTRAPLTSALNSAAASMQGF